MIEAQSECHPRGKHRYRTVVEGMELANDFARSGQSISAFARQRGVSFRMVQYWSTRARQLAVATSPDLVQVAEISANGDIKPVTPRPALPAPTVSPVGAVVSTAITPSAPMIEVRLPNGVRIGIGAGFSPEALTQVIACLGVRLC